MATASFTTINVDVTTNPDVSVDSYTIVIDHPNDDVLPQPIIIEIPSTDVVNGTIGVSQSKDILPNETYEVTAYSTLGDKPSDNFTESVNTGKLVF